MIHNMTEMIITERNTYSETEPVRCHTVEKEMARCTQGVGKVYPRCTQALGKLMSMLRSSLGAGKEQLRSSLGYAYALPTLRLRYAYATPTLCHGALAQTGLSGIYYIASDKALENQQFNYNGSSPTDRFYIVPAKDPQQTTDYRDAYYSPNHGNTTGDSNKPFLTTYKTNRDFNSVWIVKKEADNYYVIHAATGKYVIYEVPLPNDPNTNANSDQTKNGKRKTMHLQTPDDGSYSLSTNENFKFTITKDNDNIYRLQPKNRSGWYWNPANGNKETYYGQTAQIYQAGLIGVYNNSSDRGSKWHFETALLAAPTINVTGYPTVTVTDSNGLPEGYNIRYTFGDGTQADPTAESPIMEGGTYTVTEAGTLKVVIERYGIVLTEVASQEVGPTKPTFNVNADGSVTISAPGNTIYYTLNGNDPTSSSTQYSSSISASDIASATGTAIKAIAIDGNNIVSRVVTIPLATYTYKVINKSNKVATNYSIKEAEGKPLSGYTGIPVAIRSEYLNDETVTYYSFAGSEEIGGTVTPETIGAHDPISVTPEGDANIYVTYTTNNLTNKPLRLQGARPFNIKYSSNYLYDDNGTLKTDGNSESNVANHLWYIAGGDPYAVTVQNGVTSSKLTYKSAAFGYDGTVKTFIMKSASGVDETHTNATLWYIDGADIREVTVTVNTVVLPRSYTLIDRKGVVIQANIAYVDADGFGLPAAWKSPLANYHYWNADAFVQTVPGTPDVPYVLKDENGDGTPDAAEITGVTEVTSDNTIYVTYDVNKTLIDIEGKKTYLLKFSEGDSFYQESSDALSTESTQAIYPYNNGDFNLNIYGRAQWDKGLTDGASTRTRWLWYFVSNHKGTNLTGDDVDPYHVIVKSRQNQTTKVGDVTTDGNTYLYTYKPNEAVGVVTGAISDHSVVTEKPTEYMILGTKTSSMTLQTFNVVEGTSSRQTVNCFEQYWKNNPTANKLLKGDGKEVTDREESVVLTGDQRTFLQNANEGLHKAAWHSYDAWAYSAPWVKRNDGTTNKKLEKKEHWFQTISMGSGAFSVEEIDLKPVIILLDQHGWELVRLTIPSSTDTEGYAKIKKYSSPMVKAYHYWKPVAADKVDGYHKYNVSDPVLNSEVSTGGNSEHYTTEKLGELGSIPQIKDAKGNLCDLYITYEVKPEYASAYAGANNKDATQASKYLVKQGGKYAKLSDGNALSTEDTKPDIMSVPDNMQWYVKPNFDIDKEMGYIYAGETGAQDKAKTKEETEADYVTAGKNGFDPYNVQVQSAKSGADRFFTTNSSSSTLSGGVWTSTYSSSGAVSLQNENRYQISAEGNDHTTLHITNATFMVVDDGNGNMRLMPRFDNSNIVTSFTGLGEPAAAALENDEGAGTQSFYIEMVPTEVSQRSQIKCMGGYYILKEGFTCNTSIGTEEKPFIGKIDGRLRTFKFTVPLLAYAKDATIKNIMLKDVQISGTGSTGAICGTADGATRIYNCGILPNSPTFKDETSTVSGSGTPGYCGSIVGELKGNARVINCFSYATITGGTTVGGIVGYIGNTQITQNNVTDVPMVMNCMFYGEITGGSQKYPVYGGAMIKNDEGSNNGVNPYNYFRKTATFDDSYTNIDAYNRSWPAEEKNLTRFEYYRSVLNSNKNLVTYWLTDKAYNDQTGEDRALMAKWVLDPSMAPYPILKKWGYYPSVINLDTEYRINPETKAKEARSGANEWEGKSYGTLTVNINAGTNYTGNTSRNITITDMDTLNCDYGYYKIQLPYYNEVFGNPNGETHAKKYANNYTDKVVTGWKINSVTGGTPGTFEKNWETGYNFADRNCTSKDLYATSGRVFAQGGYYYVPVGVTAINIEAYWGDAVYLANRGHSIDRVSLTSAGYKADAAFGPAGTMPDKFLKTDAFAGYTVYKDLQDAIKALKTSTECPTVYDQAIVLIGNHQVKNGSNLIGYSLDSKCHPFTFMSADFDFDCEPDYCLEWQFRHDTPRKGIQPVRFDFLPIVELGLAVRHDKKAYAIGIFVPHGHFEVTETSFLRTTQFEYDGPKDENYRVTGDVGTTVDGRSPMIINGGEYEMFNFRYHDSNRTLYFLLGGKAWVHRFAPGAHPSTNTSPKAYFCAVNAIGGEYPEFYLSGIYRPDIAVPQNQGAPHCYTNGGKFGTMAGAGYDKVAGGVTFKINHSLINEFYGGGINGSNPIGGNIDVTIDYSRVEKYCGGPKVGNMAGKTVTTNATGTIFGIFFGAGNGGNSYYRELIKDGDQNSSNIASWGGQYGWGNFNPLKTTYDDSNVNKGYHAEYEFEVFNHSNGVTDQITQRSFYRWIQFGITTTGNVTSNLTDCVVNTNFYGGGNLASVTGNVTSTLTNTTVDGNAFGGGFSAAIPTFSVHDKNKVTYPSMDFAGTITDGSIGYKDDGEGNTIVYEWTNDLNGETEVNRKKNPAYEKDGKWYCYTWNSLENLGAVTGNATINIEGNTLVHGNIYNENGEVIDHAGVFGGGDASKVIGNTQVNINASGQKTEGFNTYNVYGGGNTADIEGNTNVTLSNGKVNWDIFGGGKGTSTTVTGNVTVNVGEKSSDATPAYTGTGTVRDVYGGSALGAVNATKGAGDVLSATTGKTTTVNVYAGTELWYYNGHCRKQRQHQSQSK